MYFCIAKLIRHKKVKKSCPSGFKKSVFVCIIGGVDKLLESDCD